jgi:hypothetical protein
MTFQQVLEEIEENGGVNVKNFMTCFDIRLCMTEPLDAQQVIDLNRDLN